MGGLYRGFFLPSPPTCSLPFFYNILFPMKTKLFTLLLFVSLLMVFFHSSHAQKNVLKINPLSLGLVTLNAQYERALNESTSAQLGLFYSGFSTNFPGEGRLGFSGISFTPEFRYYLSNASQDAPRGIYVGPYLRYRSLQAFFRDENGTNDGEWELNTIGGGVLLGYQWILGDVFALDIYLGPGLRNNSTKILLESEDYSIDELPGFLFGDGLGILFRFGISVGAAF
jgi:hypothetical protein